MNAVEMINLYQNLFYVSVAVAVIGLGLAVFFFFYFDIPTVYALMTGKAKEDTIRRMAEQNAKTGNLRNQYIHTGPTGKTGKTRSTGNTGALTQNVAQNEHRIVPPAAAGQTAPLAAPDQFETSVLQTPTAETTVLQRDAAETQVLGYGEDTQVLNYDQETQVLNYSEDTQVLNYGEDTQVLNYGQDAGATAVLSGASAYAYEPAQAVPNGFRFNLTENTLVIHTNEII